MNAKETSSKTRVRSPSYPLFSLDNALDKARDFYRSEARNAAAFPVAAKCWGYSPTSGSAAKALAAMQSFGLVEVSGTKNNRMINLSELALRIILDDRTVSPERDDSLHTAALLPPLHKKLWDKWGDQLPSDENMRHTLIFDYKFNERFVADFIRKYKVTISFSGLANKPDEETEEIDTTQDDIIDLDNRYDAPEKINPLINPKPNLMHLAKNEVEIAKYPVGKNCTIKLIGSCEVNKRTIESLVAQLNLAIELGTFDDEKE